MLFQIKLYRDQGTGRPKGDGLCTYVKVESVSLALQILDGSTMVEGGANGKTTTVSVTRAKFEMKGER